MADSSRDNYTRRLAEYLAGINQQSLSGQLRDKLRLHILDTLGAGLFGTITPWNSQVREVALSWGGHPEAWLWGTNTALPIPSAVLVNGMACHSFELDDTHVHSAVHPGSGTVSTALAIGQAAGEGAYKDDEVLVAILAGYEASIRIGIAAGAASFERGFYPPGIALAFGSAAVAGKLYGFDADLMTHCLALTATQASGLYSPTSLKRFNIGNGARAGVVAAQLAKAGLKGPQDPLEAQVGGLGEAFANRVNWDGSLETMGKRFCIWDVGLKRYSCSRPNHTAIDAVAEIRSRRGGLNPDEVEQIHIVCSTPSYRYGVGFEIRDTPSAFMSIAYCAAAMLVYGEVSVEQFSEKAINNPEVRRILALIRVKASEEIDRLGPARRDVVDVTIRLKTGETHSIRVENGTGQPERPLPADEVRRKFVRLGTYALPEERVLTIQSAVDRLGTGSVYELIGLMRR